MIKLDVVEHGAIQLKYVGPAVVIVVEKFHGDAAQENRFVADAGAIGGIIESAILIVMVKAIQFEIEMRDVDILPAIAVDVGGVDAHPCLVAAVFAGGHSRNEGDILKGAVMLVDKKKIRPGIVGNGDVGPAVIVEVSEDDAHAFRFRFADS